MAIPKIDSKQMQNFLVELLNIPSPSGLTDNAIDFVDKEFSKLKNVSTRHTRKGALIITLAGEQNTAPRGLSAHVDTLGAQVKIIKSNGRLQLSRVGGLSWNGVEGEGCTVFTRDGKAIRGSFMLIYSSAHVNGAKLGETKRSADTLEVRLDEKVTNADETRKLGIQEGDFVAFDPRVETVNGFIRSRHLDDKACVANLYGAAAALSKAGRKPRQTAHFLISNYEEVGHGAATGFPPEVGELVVVDMAAVGDGQASDEYHTTICVQDSSGPYDYKLSNQLRSLADANKIPYKVDIYPNYGSDGSALLRTGADIRVALIGPGVDASHNYERTHMDAMNATTQWILAYLLS